MSTPKVPPTPSSPRRSIQRIADAKNKSLTFNRRRLGLFKKAYELSVLCDAKVVVLVYDTKNACHVYSSEEPEEKRDNMLRTFLDKDFITNDPLRNNSPQNLQTGEALPSWQNQDDYIASVTTYRAEPSRKDFIDSPVDLDSQPYAMKSSTSYHSVPRKEKPKDNSFPPLNTNSAQSFDLPFSPSSRGSNVDALPNDWMNTFSDQSWTSPLPNTDDILSPSPALQHNNSPMDVDKFPQYPSVHSRRTLYGSRSRPEYSSIKRTQSLKTRRTTKPKVTRIHTAHPSIDGHFDYIHNSPLSSGSTIESLSANPFIPPEPRSHSIEIENYNCLDDNFSPNTCSDTIPEISLSADNENLNIFNDTTGASNSHNTFFDSQSLNDSNNVDISDAALMQANADWHALTTSHIDLDLEHQDTS
ncbi:MADS-box transcription factor Mbx1 [Schizosaccharomyces cryophilus OY26]|uniref:MADS-box transcription factor Mbx1 n=1 Tax=Schizosaccharomyces cryophilus (strain OY26 / ATCC MYA-4695 / CBS 11777 / NBRC 106824 / NRRL Y48691) TaxID=653667 RepID=S9W4N8_SCHCR|nr:MADS-box transcription factor Mbx1 [Schizosaccharomyces cryophilus OY26]EPY52875.1 MADS-box transcription factor Mbx1 [Schizosaccharomyces cryophilus OY26]